MGMMAVQDIRTGKELSEEAAKKIALERWGYTGTDSPIDYEGLSSVEKPSELEKDTI